MSDAKLAKRSVGEGQSVSAAVKPRLRGVTHIAAAFVALAAGGWLAWASPTLNGTYASLAFTGSLFVQFSVSGLYHGMTWSPKIRQWWRRADHAAIFVLIAGTYTPICLLALQGDLGNKLLLLVWSGAVIGITQSLFWVTLPKPLTACLYLALGWLAVRYKEEILAKTGWNFALLIVAGGILYSIGALAYVIKWPNPYPRVFGYHEVFHVFVILAAATHFAAISSLVLGSCSCKDSGFWSF